MDFNAVLNYVVELLLNTWRPIVEIALMAVALYVIGRFMRGTRGAGILRGLFLFLIVSFVVVYTAREFAGLERVAWILERLLALLLVGVIIIFQPEIRRALVRLGEAPMLTIFGNKRSSLIDEIVEAVSNMAKRKVGALIALQRDVGLGSYIEGGVLIEAEVSAELLTTIFTPNAALHDGGVIIRRGHVAAAGCLFPLTENPSVSKELGMRHRAGIGVTEETDAVAVIVSEETGEISLGVKGDLMRGLSGGDLRSILRDLWVEVEEDDLGAAA